MQPPSRLNLDSVDNAAPASVTKEARRTKRIKSQDLFQQAREVEIEHAGRIYTLRLTQLNKLILTA